MLYDRTFALCKKIAFVPYLYITNNQYFIKVFCKSFFECYHTNINITIVKFAGVNY